MELWWWSQRATMAVISRPMAMRTVTSPGNDPYVITVGAMKPMGTPTRLDDLIASYSSKGPTRDRRSGEA